MKKSITGNILLITLILTSGILYYYSFTKSSSRFFDASIMTFVMVFFYFYGKGIYFNNIKIKNEQINFIYKLIVVTVAIFIPFMINNKHFEVENWSVFSLSICASLLIGFDINSYIDSALESQVYKEIPKGSAYLAINMFVYIALSILLIIFFPKLF